MLGLNLLILLVLVVPAVLANLATVALTKAFQSYSRSRLEEYCADRGRPELAAEIDHLDERTERAAEAIAAFSGLFLATLIGVALDRWQSFPRLEFLLILVLTTVGAGFVVAAVLGRVFAERILLFFWPATPLLRNLAWPVTASAVSLEYLTERFASDPENGPRPASVEVEIPTEEGETAEEVEAELPEAAHQLLQRAVELTRTHVSEVMIPSSSIVSLPSTVTALEAAETFRETGRSRIPLFGANRDDIVGILIGKDLWERMVDSDEPQSVVPAQLVRPAYCVPETSNAYRVIEELRRNRTGMAIVLDEYGSVAGLVTLEDLLEQLVGPIDDEHDVPARADAIRPLEGSRYDVDASLPLEVVNDRLGLHLSTEEEYETIGGLALHTLGRLPEDGEKFRQNGIEFTVLDVREQAIRRVLIDLHPHPAAANGPHSREK
ncbi:MAG: hemolysin family protein [Isosphaeraceae bacterium]